DRAVGAHRRRKRGEIALGVALRAEYLVRVVDESHATTLTVDEHAVQRTEEAPRAARHVRQPRETRSRIVGTRAPETVDDLRRGTFELLGRALEVLRPESQPRSASDARVLAHEVHLRVVEQRVVVEVRRADREPAVVDDA